MAMGIAVSRRGAPGVLAVAALVAALVGPAIAGECSHEAQVCLDQLARMRDRGYAGVELDSEAPGVGWPVTKVYAETPAAAAGIRVGDVLIAIGGVRLGDEEEMPKLATIMKPGERVAFTIAREGVERVVEVGLVRMPDDVFARVVGEHMLEHTTTTAAAPPE
jgi:S1-C subfamily serine protease